MFRTSIAAESRFVGGRLAEPIQSEITTAKINQQGAASEMMATEPAKVAR